VVMNDDDGDEVACAGSAGADEAIPGGKDGGVVVREDVGPTVVPTPIGAPVLDSTWGLCVPRDAGTDEAGCTPAETGTAVVAPDITVGSGGPKAEGRAAKGDSTGTIVVGLIISSSKGAAVGITASSQMLSPPSPVPISESLSPPLPEPPCPLFPPPVFPPPFPEF
jgi:hypothetical protein